MADNQDQINSTTKDILTAVQGEQTQIDGVVTLITQLETTVAGAKSLSPEDQQNINDAMTALKAQAAELVTALTTTPTGNPAPVTNDASATSTTTSTDGGQ